MFGLNCGFDLKNIADLRAIWGGGGAEHMGELQGACFLSIEAQNVSLQKKISNGIRTTLERFEAWHCAKTLLDASMND